MNHIVKIKLVEHVTHDVLHIVAEKPADLDFKPGQAVEISINKDDWKQELRPFTFTSLPKNQQIEFTIKTYPSHNGVTNQLLSLVPGDELILHDVFGTILYKGEGIFIAGGAGVTPFISILKDLEDKNQIGHNKLIFANKTKSDIILEDRFRDLLGANFINILSKEELNGYYHGYISADLIKKHIDNNTHYFYICGPDPMIDTIEKQLYELKITPDRIVREIF
ncbi:oxidoreductase FAD/NAD(P)-binding domain protein [Pseudopedobacter saltans DSM 12145]|uniref:Oxidoreductase FAD/NAD(P)-binding domain protein n=1 Tax=Pseudopedobacter saltans (strain ATCC 51119 / DSM 12145 / JCM 21818 / CCUG 39354 / LMG 10337 / NBRC 100064 / NCIMB 13643) TaxID=762903 RepID=F0S4L2_PSESL|nr:flavodoxin reductase [Pseudopedobacter saltans]ADY52003.1 oxidoreductase FAD/NAD(P)-binding domain protein [Pseudopedobacter saltans DSM 12145]